MLLEFEEEERRVRVKSVGNIRYVNLFYFYF